MDLYDELKHTRQSFRYEFGSFGISLCSSDSSSFPLFFLLELHSHVYLDVLLWATKLIVVHNQIEHNITTTHPFYDISCSFGFLLGDLFHFNSFCEFSSKC